VDFWADWCGPCKMLMPILDKLALEYDGRFRVAKVDTESERELAAAHGIRSLPTVKVFCDGVEVDEFMGALPERGVREVIERHIARPGDAEIEKATALAADDNRQGAISLLAAALASDPGYLKVRLALAEHQIEAGESAAAAEVLREVPMTSAQDPQVKRLRVRIELALSADATLDVESLRKKIEQTPDDLEARTQLAQCVMRDPEQVETAMTEFLEVIRRGRGNELAEQARSTLVQIFESLGARDERVSRYRRQLAQALN
ncbi:MAG TPA: co-chaperone YbbN, partial [Gammaproteobacteria bacterium]|nr:co-chaperone YbbN [Gammaproteobacteria bacterium]